MDDRNARRRRWTRGLFLPALSLTLAFALAACGGESPTDSVATLSSDDTGTEDVSDDNSGSDEEVTEEERQQAILDFARCMREHGIDMPDPTFDENGRGAMSIGGGADGEARPDESVMEAAQEACEPLMEDVIGAGPQDQDPEEVAKMQEQALAFAKCMRDHGVDFPDPQFEGGGRMTQSMTADPNDPTFQAAQEACATEGGPGMVFGSGEVIGSTNDGGGDQ